MDSDHSIATGIGDDHSFGLNRSNLFATGMTLEAFVRRKYKPVTSEFDRFGTATARLRPRYRHGSTWVDGDGHHAR